jgi:hypothetical protein
MHMRVPNLQGAINRVSSGLKSAQHYVSARGCLYYLFLAFGFFLDLLGFGPVQ